MTKKRKPKALTLNQYQSRAMRTLISEPNEDPRLILARMLLGMPGELGEVCEKTKKLLRGDSQYKTRRAKSLTSDFKLAVALELGDVLWYVGAVAYLLDIDLETVGRLNQTKLSRRFKTNQIKGSGDHR